MHIGVLACVFLVAVVAEEPPMPSYGRGDGIGPWSTLPVRSRRAEPLAPSPRGGSRGGGDDRVPGVGGLAEAVDGLEIGGDGEKLLDKYDIPVEVSGEGALAPADGFEAAGLVEAVLRNVARCGYDNPTPVQRYAMPIVMAGRDLMACAQTGSGKTAAFCLPVVSGLVAPAGGGSGYGYGRRDMGSFDRVAKPRALVLAPTRELAAQINEEAKKFSFQTGLRVVVAYGGTPMYNQLRDLERGVDLLVATPGRLVDMVERSRISLEAIKYLVLDEADRMLDMGFEPQIRKIVDMMNMPKKSVRQTMLFSATFPPEIQRLASDLLDNFIFVTVGRVGSSTDLIEQKIESVNDGDKRGFLIDLLQKQSIGVADSKKTKHHIKKWVVIFLICAAAILVAVCLLYVVLHYYQKWKRSRRPLLSGGPPRGWRLHQLLSLAESESELEQVATVHSTTTEQERPEAAHSGDAQSSAESMSAVATLATVHSTTEQEDAQSPAESASETLATVHSTTTFHSATTQMEYSSSPSSPPSLSPPPVSRHSVPSTSGRKVHSEIREVGVVDDDDE